MQVPTDRSKSRRGLTVFDLGLLVAATACGIAFVRWAESSNEDPGSQWSPGEVFWKLGRNRGSLPGAIAWFGSLATLALVPSRARRIAWFVAGFATVGSIAWFVAYPKPSGQLRFIITGPLAAFAVPFTLFLIPAGLRRARVRRALARPGMVASCASGVGLVGEGLRWAVYEFRLMCGLAPSIDWLDPRFVWQMTEPALGWAVAAAWAALALGGRWRPESSWVDRSGRVLGSFWVGTLLFDDHFFHWIA